MPDTTAGTVPITSGFRVLMWSRRILTRGGWTAIGAPRRRLGLDRRSLAVGRWLERIQSPGTADPSTPLGAESCQAELRMTRRLFSELRTHHTGLAQTRLPSGTADPSTPLRMTRRFCSELFGRTTLASNAPTSIAGATSLVCAREAMPGLRIAGRAFLFGDQQDLRIDSEVASARATIPGRPWPPRPSTACASGPAAASAR
jgi:hypothetical protein